MESFFEILFNYAQALHHLIFFILVLCSVASITVLANRFLYFKKLKKSDDKDILLDYLTRTEVKDLNAYDIRLPEAYNYYLTQGFEYMKKCGKEGLTEVLDAIIIEERSRSRKTLPYAAFVAANAPFIGLLGTVLGIMDSFRSLAQSSGEANQVMTGISEALIATFLGLFVAIVAVGIYNTYQNKSKDYIDELSKYKLMMLAKIKGK